jgi:hypothetical protein
MTIFLYQQPERRREREKKSWKKYAKRKYFGKRRKGKMRNEIK